MAVVPAEPMEPEAPFVETAYEELTDDARRALDFLSGMVERMGVQAQFKACETPEQLRVQLFGENMSVLIGRRGETLDALQYLTSLTVNRGREAYLRVSLDTETTAPSAKKRCASWLRAWPTAAKRPASAWRSSR